MVPDATLGALFLTGLLGGVHCAGMCGGIVGALGLLDARTASAPPAAPPMPLRFVPAAATGAPVRLAAVPAHGGRRGLVLAPARLVRLLAYNGGRLSSYTLLGAGAGAAGSFAWLFGNALPLQQIAYAASSALLVAMGLYVAGRGQVARRLERLGVGLWARVRPLATRALARAGTPGGAFAAGALWGLVPCGMVYAALVVALLGGDAARGAALMLAFGLGTLPNLLLLGTGATWLSRLTGHGAARTVAGLVIAGYGVLGFARLDVARALPIIGELCLRLPGLGT